MKSHRDTNRILLAGIPRCGSTWLANVLGQASSTRTVYEPDGPMSDVLGALVATRLGAYPVLQPDQHSSWYELVWDLAFVGGWPWDRVEGARVAGRRLVRFPPAVRDSVVAALAYSTARLRPKPDNVVVKTVNSAFTVEWIAERYSPKVVVLHRNPINVVSSWLVLDMNKWPVGSAPDVRQRILDPLGISPPSEGCSEVTSIAWNVGLMIRALKLATESHAEWIPLSYDDLSTDPLDGCKTLFGQLDLDWTREAEGFLEQADDPAFVVHGGSRKVHPNAVTATEGSSRRTQQGSQYRRRLTDDQIMEACDVLGQFDLGDWGPKL